MIARIATEPPPRPDPAAVPDQVATVIAHALAKQPQYRPRSAAAFGQALQNAQRELGQRVTAMPVADSAPDATVVPTRSPYIPPAQSPATQSPATPASESPVVASAGERAAASQPAPVHSDAAASGPATEHVPFTPPVNTTTAPAPRPFSKTIAALSVIAVLLAAAVGGLLFYQTQRGPVPIAVTSGGARILSYDALDSTELPPPFDEAKALDRDDSTYWGVMPAADGTGIVGTSYVIKLAEEQQIVSVGISHGEGTDLGRAAEIIWGTSIDDLESQDPSIVTQPLPDQPGVFMTPFEMTTDQIVLAIFDVHGDPDMLGIAEILIEVEGSSSNG